MTRSMAKPLVSRRPAKRASPAAFLRKNAQPFFPATAMNALSAATRREHPNPRRVLILDSTPPSAGRPSSFSGLPVRAFVSARKETYSPAFVQTSPSRPAKSRSTAPRTARGSSETGEAGSSMRHLATVPSTRTRCRMSPPTATWRMCSGETISATDVNPPFVSTRKIPAVPEEETTRREPCPTMSFAGPMRRSPSGAGAKGSVMSKVRIDPVSFRR